MKLSLIPLLVIGFNMTAAMVPGRAAEGNLKKATYCHGFKEDQSPKDVAEFFNQGEAVFLSIQLKGRPKSGVVRAEFMFRDDQIAEAKVDVATVNEGVIFSFGEDTFVGFDIKPKEALPVGACYLTKVTFDGKPLGEFPFRIAPPKDAIPSKLVKAALAKGADEDHKPVNETHEFDGLEKAFLTGVGSLGVASWLEATWMVNGKVDDDGTRSFTMEENKENVPFHFAFIPAGGWPAGTHEVSLQLNGQEVVHEKFTVKVGAPMAGKTKLDIDASQLFRDDGKGEPGKEVKSFTTDDTGMHVGWNLKQKALIKGVQVVWRLVEAEGEKEQVLVTADVEAGVSDEIESALTAKNGLPAGKYRVDLVQDGKVVDSKAFEVK
ncbi:MAG: hypothetical protein K9N47_23240 [Prosthecobacter sp.]|uniref:hypothetical protein n=1 Tax=Prosthecobacter sp. TaxID=1965333 RepID=UPI0026268FB7|nr:hypothetical protein [Prosthecobacter sp.]MCF7789058.1 hypothetical protein [Prosthecobacter sp.]